MLCVIGSGATNSAIADNDVAALTPNLLDSHKPQWRGTGSTATDTSLAAIKILRSPLGAQMNGAPLPDGPAAYIAFESLDLEWPDVPKMRAMLGEPRSKLMQKHKLSVAAASSARNPMRSPSQKPLAPVPLAPVPATPVITTGPDGARKQEGMDRVAPANQVETAHPVLEKATVAVDDLAPVLPEPALSIADKQTPMDQNVAPVEAVEDQASLVQPVANGVESLRDAIVASLKNNPDIQIALAQQEDAQYAVNEARAAYLPHVDVSASFGTEYNRNGNLNSTTLNRLETNVTLNQNIWDFGITINDIKRAKASYRSAQWSTRERIEAISYEITSAYLGLLQQQKLVDLAEAEIAATQKILRVVTVQKNLGLTTPADVSRAQTKLENIQSILLDRKSALEQARSSYRRLTGHAPGRAVDLASAENALPESAEMAVAMIDAHNPRMAQAVEDRRSLAKQYSSQKGTFFPRIGLQLQGNHKNNVQGATGMANDGRAMVTVSYNLFNGGADRAILHRLGARLREADYELDRRRREVEQDVRVDFEGLKSARAKIATISAEIESATRVVELYRQQFREGKRTVFDLLDSEQILFSAKNNRITNELAMHAAEYRVLQKLGGLFNLASNGEPLPKLALPVEELRKQNAAMASELARIQDK